MVNMSHKQKKKNVVFIIFLTLLNEPETKMLENHFSEPSYQHNVATFA